MDDNYQTYLNRVARMTLPETYKSQVQHIQPSPKFKLYPGGNRAVPFPGYTIMTPTAAADTTNSSFYEYLRLCQQQLLQLPESDLIVPVPPASFHFTLADLIWDSAFRYANENPEFEAQLRDRVATIFQDYQQSLTQTSELRWQLLGLSMMPRAIGVFLVPQDENSYNQILHFRRKIYQNPELTKLGIEQHYHFTAHITLGYFGNLSANLDRDRLSDSLFSFNQQWQEQALELSVYRAELQKFDDMTHYYREPDWPAVDLG